MIVDENSFLFTSDGMQIVKDIKTNSKFRVPSLQEERQIYFYCSRVKSQCIDLKTTSGYHITLSYDTVCSVIRNGFLIQLQVKDVIPSLDYLLLNSKVIDTELEFVTKDYTKDMPIPLELRNSSTNSIITYLRNIFKDNFQVNKKGFLEYKSDRFFNIIEMQRLLSRIGVFSNITKIVDNKFSLEVIDLYALKVLCKYIPEIDINLLQKTEMKYPVPEVITKYNRHIVDKDNCVTLENIHSLKIDGVSYVSKLLNSHFYVDKVTHIQNVGFRNCLLIKENPDNEYVINNIFLKIL